MGVLLCCALEDVLTKWQRYTTLNIEYYKKVEVFHF